MTGFFSLLGEVLGLRQIDDSQHETTMIVGSGVTTRQERELMGCFDALEVSGSIDVELRHGDLCTVAVVGDDNLVDLVETSLSAMRLYVGFKPNTSLSTKIGLKVILTAPEVDEAELNGSGGLSMFGLSQQELRVRLNGSGDVDLSGTVKTASLHVHGSGEIDAIRLKAREASVRVHGSGDVGVHATDVANVSIHGSGDVIVNGNPKDRKVESHGSGDVRFAKPSRTT